MTTEELCQRVAEIEGWDIVSYPDNHSGCSNHMFIKGGVMHSARSFCFRLIEKYKLEIDWNYPTGTWEICYWHKLGPSFNTCVSLAEDKDLLTAVFKAVIEVNE